MHDPPSVGHREGGRDLVEDPGRSLVGDRVRAIDQLAEAASSEEPRHDVCPTRLPPVVVDRRDVGVLQRCDGLRVGFEAADERRIVRPMFVHDPDRDLPAHVRLRRPVDHAERVLAHAFEQSVAAQRFSTGIQVGALGEDPFVQLSELGRGIDPELVGEDLAGPLEGSQRLALSPGAVQGEHQLFPETLPERMTCREVFELADDLSELSDRELRIDPFLEGREA